MSLVNGFAGPIFTVGDGRDGGSGGRINANGAFQGRTTQSSEVKPNGSRVNSFSEPCVCGALVWICAALLNSPRDDRSVWQST